MKLTLQVLPCDFFDWWFSPKELWEYWLVHIDVPAMGLQTPSAPWVLSLALSLRTLCSVQWMAVSLHFYICQALAEPLRRQLYEMKTQYNTDCGSQSKQFIESDLYLRTCIIIRTKIPK